jgi:ATP phosphoribosyltransferase
MSTPLILALPSKGRLMQQTEDRFTAAGLTVRKTGDPRGYRGAVDGLSAVEVAFVSSAEITQLLRTGEVHLGVTGEDLLRESIADCAHRVTLLAPLGFGRADVVVAVPEFWIDVTSMADLEEAAALFRRRHGRRMRVATKYLNLTRRFFSGERIGDTEGTLADTVSSYRIVESAGATEGAPASGAAELIVDITTTGATLEANGLRVLTDGTILRSEANLIRSHAAPWCDATRAAEAEIVRRLTVPVGGQTQRI